MPWRSWERDLLTDPGSDIAIRETARIEREKRERAARLAREAARARATELAITDSTVVEFDGVRTTWGALMLADRKTVKRDIDGVLRGGYGF